MPVLLIVLYIYHKYLPPGPPLSHLQFLLWGHNSASKSPCGHKWWERGRLSRIKWDIKGDESNWSFGQKYRGYKTWKLFHLLAATARLIAANVRLVALAVTHRVATGGIQHGRRSAEQAEELSAAPLLCWQVPAWVDHLQREQRWGHSLEERQDKGVGEVKWPMDVDWGLKSDIICIFCKSFTNQWLYLLDWLVALQLLWVSLSAVLTLSYPGVYTQIIDWLIDWLIKWAIFQKKNLLTASINYKQSCSQIACPCLL